MAEANGRITIKEGGWVLILMGIVLTSIIVWAIAPAFLRMNETVLGDNETPESYQFDLSNLSISRDVLTPVMHHRNMSPVLTDPEILSAVQIENINKFQRSPFLVSKDLVVGVLLNGEARAYPLHMLHVHEIVNDTLGGIPIVVSWHWPSGHLAVHQRAIEGEVLAFANSGLAGNGSLLMYPMQDQEGGEQLFSPILGRSVTGEHVPLEPVSFEATPWKSWVASHPNTTATKPNEQFKKRYRKGDPKTYFLNDTIYFQASPMPDQSMNPKTQVIVLQVDKDPVVYAIDSLINVADEHGNVAVNLENTPVTITVSSSPLSAVARYADGSLVNSQQALWFAWYANHPNTQFKSP